MRSEKIGAGAAGKRASGEAVREVAAEEEVAATMVSPGDSALLAGTLDGATIEGVTGGAVAGAGEAADAMRGADARSGPKPIHATSASTTKPSPSTAMTSPRGAFASAAARASDAEAMRGFASTAAAEDSSD